MSTMGGGCTIWCGGEIGCKRCRLFVSAQGHELTRQQCDVDEAWHWIVLSLDDELGDAGEGWRDCHSMSLKWKDLMASMEVAPKPGISRSWLNPDEETVDDYRKPAPFDPGGIFRNGRVLNLGMSP
jgi:hypothetical protein